MKESTAFIRHMLFFVVLLGLAILQLFITFRGLDDKMAMEQAQIAREISRGNGFVTKSITPIAWAKATAESETNSVSLQHVPDVHYAPLNPLLESTVFSIIGADDTAKWAMTKDYNIYKLDRIIAALGIILFLISLGISYFLINRIFDAKIAGFTVVSMMLCNLYWDFATSGLPMMLMFTCFSAGLLFLYKATDNLTKERPVFSQMILSIFFMCLMCLAHWPAIVIFLGYLIYISIAFQPKALYGIIGALLMSLLSGYFLYRNYVAVGNILGTTWLELYNGLMGQNEHIMRSSDLKALETLNTRDLILNFFNSIFAQFKNFYSYFGAILAAPIFFLALMHRFSSALISKFRWGILTMFVFALIGMTLFGAPKENSPNQFLILFAPIMSAYGLAFIAIVWNRVSLNNMTWAKNLPILIIVALSALPMLFGLPNAIRGGVSSGTKGVPQWPPYYPFALNSFLTNASDPKNALVSDQPWAVAWYADRAAFWMPFRVDEFDQLNKKLEDQNSQIDGILISPVSHHEYSLGEIAAKYDEFAPLVLDEPLRSLSNQSINFASSSPKLTPLLTRYSGKQNKITIISGPNSLVFYTQRSITASKSSK